MDPLRWAGSRAPRICAYIGIGNLIFVRAFKFIYRSLDKAKTIYNRGDSYDKPHPEFLDLCDNNLGIVRENEEKDDTMNFYSNSNLYLY
jgi:hypothetical protein